jgi:hypothetical protein
MGQGQRGVLRRRRARCGRGSKVRGRVLAEGRRKGGEEGKKGEKKKEKNLRKKGKEKEKE